MEAQQLGGLQRLVLQAVCEVLTRAGHRGRPPAALGLAGAEPGRLLP
jgi:hypothetical protein